MTHVRLVFDGLNLSQKDEKWYIIMTKIYSQQC